MVAGSIYPAFVQRFQVAPNELTLERPYIARQYRLYAARLCAGQDRGDAATTPPGGDAGALLTEPETMRNVRLWDYRPLLQTYNQVQALRQYYEFNDVDVDRYIIDGDASRCMVAARELVPERLNSDAQTWVNLKLVYTHGYGVAMSPVAQVTADGLPDFYLKDLPVTGVISVTQPQVYFGELTGRLCDRPHTLGGVRLSAGHRLCGTPVCGDTGIDMSLWNRLLFALRFGDINILLEPGHPAGKPVALAAQHRGARDAAGAVPDLRPGSLCRRGQ